MAWIKLDDGFLEHLKFEGVTDGVLAFWIRGLAFSCRHLMDGHVPRRLARTKTDRAHAAELVRRGLWEVTEGGWRVHDFHHYQPTREAVKRRRQQGRERQARWREDHLVTPSVMRDEGVSHTVTNDAPSRTRPVPVPEEQRLLPSDIDDGVTGNGLKPMPDEMRAQMAALFKSKGVPPVSDSEVRNEALRTFGRTLDPDEVG